MPNTRTRSPPMSRLSPSTARARPVIGAPIGTVRDHGGFQVDVQEDVQVRHDRRSRPACVAAATRTTARNQKTNEEERRTDKPREIRAG